jgi:hypothetical protein
MVIAAAQYLDEELLLAGAELTWLAGPHRMEKGAQSATAPPATDMRS